MNHSRLLTAALAATAFVLTSCGQEQAAPAEEAGHHAGGIKVTNHSGLTELFVEYRPLAAGKRRRFDAHLSWMADYRAVTEGTLTAELVWADGSADRASAKVSDTPGIFRPLLTPRRAGKARLRLVHNSARGASAHDLGEVTVHATSEAAANAAPEEVEREGAIAFTKEVQWRIPFLVTPAQVSNLPETVPVTVDVRLAPHAEAVVSAPVDGIVRTARVPIQGMSVARGQVLGSVSSTLGAGQDLATLDLSIAEARIAREAAAREVTRMNTLVRAEAVPQRRLDEARTSLRLAQAQLGAAQQRRSALAGGGGGVPLVAPISGTVLASSLVQGKGVKGGDELLRIGNPSSLWLVARVPESLAARVTDPSGLELVLPGQAIVLGRGDGLALVQRGGYVDPQTRTLDVIFAWSGGSVRPGQRLQGRLLSGGAATALTVPASAILNEGGQDVVYVQIAGETFERRAVSVTRRSGNWVAVEGQLKAGDRVVARGAAAVRAAAATPGAFGHGHAH